MAKKKTRSKSAAASKGYKLHVVSDATGSLASHLINAILTQFPDVKIKQVYHTFADSHAKIGDVIRRFGQARVLVLHSLVDPDAKRAIEEACAGRSIPHFDLTGSLVQFLSDHTGVQPVNQLSRLHRVDAGYFQRVEAMEYTMQHDDGRGLETLREADVVIVGLSRVSKTPTSTFLGAKGYKVANVSITRETGFPAELAKVKTKIVALTIQPRALSRIRGERLVEFGVEEPTAYAKLRSVIEEVMWAQEQYRARGYPVLDISDLTVEQIGANVLKLRKLRKPHQAFL